MTSLYKHTCCLLFLMACCMHVHAQTIITIAGNGITQYIGDGAPATVYSLGGPRGIFVDKRGAVYVADFYNDRIRKIYHDTLSTIAGNGTPGYNGDGGAATAAELENPDGICMDTAGNFYITEYYNDVIRKVDAHTGTIHTICGSGSAGYSGDGGSATAAELQSPSGGCVDSAGNFYFADYNNHRVRKVSSTGVITTVAGTGTPGAAGNNGPATGAELNYPNSVCLDKAGNLYIAEYGSNDIRKIDHATDVITIVAGTGIAGYSGEGGPATAAMLNNPNSVFVDKNGYMYISDYRNNVIRTVSPKGFIYTIAGTGATGYSGDGGPAINATFRKPAAVFVDDTGNVFIADGDNSVIRKMGPIGPFRDAVAAVTMPSFSLFPNPSDGRFTVQLPETAADATIEVCNTLGQVIYTTPVAGNRVEVELHGASPGLYLVQYLSPSGRTVQKVVIH